MPIKSSFIRTYKVYGTLLKQTDKTEKGIITLLDTTLCSHFSKPEFNWGKVKDSDDKSIFYEWINIPDPKIDSFCILPA